MKYTNSKDGVKRANIHLGTTRRWTREELEDFNKKARALGFKDIRDYVSSKMVDLLYMQLDDEYEEHQIEDEGEGGNLYL